MTRRWPQAVEEELLALERAGVVREVRLNEANAPLSQVQLVEALLTTQILCPTVTDVLSAAVFQAAREQGEIKTRLLANFGVGYNHIDLASAGACDISVTNTPGVLTDATAELALTLLLMTARRTGEGEREVRSGNWSGWHPTHMLSQQVTGRTLGIVGMGRIGLALARKAHHGLGMRILYCNRSRVAHAEELELEATYMPLDALLERADFVSLNCPATPETHHLIDARRLAIMPRHAHLINTARGDVVDESALAQALVTGGIAGAGLDVYEGEPRVDSRLLALDNVVLLPHMGSGTTATREAMGRCALANIRAFIDGRVLPDLVEA